MTDITLTRSEVETLLDGLLDTQGVLDRVDYYCDNMDPKNVEKTAPFAVGYSKSTVNSVIEYLQNKLER